MNSKGPDLPRPMYEEFPNIKDPIDQFDLPFFINEEMLPMHDNRTFIICVIDCFPSFRLGREEINERITLLIQDFIDQAQIFTSRKSISKRRRGQINLAELKSHPLLHLGVNQVFSIKPPPTFKEKISLFKLQTILNKSDILFEFNIQTVWLSADVAGKNPVQCQVLFKYIFDRFALVEQRKIQEEEGAIGLGIEV